LPPPFRYFRRFRFDIAIIIDIATCHCAPAITLSVADTPAARRRRWSSMPIRFLLRYAFISFRWRHIDSQRYFAITPHISLIIFALFRFLHDIAYCQY
jgi:hypothetical protein